jgi:hypothetical protein
MGAGVRQRQRSEADVVAVGYCNADDGGAGSKPCIECMTPALHWLFLCKTGRPM